MIKNLKKIRLPGWLLILLAVVFVLRIPSFFEPYSYGDEMIYLSMGEAVRQGVPLYKTIHDNKPPLLYLTAALAGNLFWFRTILCIWNLFTIVVFWKLTQVILKRNEKAQIVATSFFAIFTTLPLLEGNIANAEIFMIGTTITAFYFILAKKQNLKNIFAAGILLSLSSLFKMPAAFEVPTVIFLWLVLFFDKKIDLNALIKRSFLLAFGFLVPIAISFIFYYLQGALKEYFIAAYAQNVGYLSSWRPDDVQKPFLVKNGPLLIRSAICGLSLFFVLIFRKKFSKTFIFTSAWLLFSLFAITLSERPYPHYLIQAIPSVSILIGIFVASPNMEQIFSLVPLTLFFFVPFYYKFWYYPTTPYYERFVNFAFGKISHEQYINSFNSKLTYYYDVARYVDQTTSKTEKTFIWGNGSIIYALSRRLPPTKYVADYHISDFSSKEEVLSQLKTISPALIIVLSDSASFTDLTRLLSERYVLVYQNKEAEVWKSTKSILK